MARAATFRIAARQGLVAEPVETRNGHAAELEGEGPVSNAGSDEHSLGDLEGLLVAERRPNLDALTQQRSGALRVFVGERGGERGEVHHDHGRLADLTGQRETFLSESYRGIGIAGHRDTSPRCEAPTTAKVQAQGLGDVDGPFPVDGRVVQRAD